MLVMSAADAACANAYGPGLPAFIAKMNAEAAKLGLTHTHFTSPDGLPYPTETSTYSTPAELTRLGEVAMGYQEFRSIVGLRYYNLPKGDGHSAVSVTSDNALLADYRGAVGIKTGFTNTAGHPALRGGGAVTAAPLSVTSLGSRRSPASPPPPKTPPGPHLGLLPQTIPVAPAFPTPHHTLPPPDSSPRPPEPSCMRQIDNSKKLRGRLVCGRCA